MAFKIYNTIADYNADPLPLEESRVSLVKKDNYGVTIDEIKYDSVGRTTEQPLVGDVCCLDENNNIKFLVGGNSLSGTLPQGWTLVGFAFNRSGNNVKIFDKTIGQSYWLACWQYAITKISSTNITIGLRMSNDYNTVTSVSVTLPNTNVDESNAKLISSAIAAKAIEVGDTKPWWAWLDHTITVGGKMYVQDFENNASGESVDAPYCWTNGSDHLYTKTVSVEARGENASSINNTAYSSSVTGSANSFDITSTTDNNRIIVQTDTFVSYTQHTITGTGCTIALSVYDDMPESGVLLRKTGVSSDRGLANIEECVKIYSTRGNVPSSDVSIKSTTIVKKTSFEESSYCAALRTEYGTFRNYIAANCVKYPQKYGVFNMLDAAEMTHRYSTAIAPAKAGGTIYKFPIFGDCASVNYDSDGLRTGNWHVCGITDAVELFSDNVLDKVKQSQGRIGVTPINMSYNYWLANRGTNRHAWYYYAYECCLNCWGLFGAYNYVISICTLDLTQINQSNNS